MRIVPFSPWFVGGVWANPPVGVTSTEISKATSILCISSSIPRNVPNRLGAALWPNSASVIAAREEGGPVGECAASTRLRVLDITPHKSRSDDLPSKLVNNAATLRSTPTIGAVVLRERVSRVTFVGELNDVLRTQCASHEIEL